MNQLVESILSKTKVLRQEFHSILTHSSSIRLYEQAFVHPSIDPVYNYERYEQLGDLSINKFVVNYFYRRFPHLQHCDGVKTVARLRINYASRQELAKIADSLGFWPHIQASEEEKNIHRDNLLEDVFEAFFGVTEYLIDKHVRMNVGYAIVYDILASIFDEIEVSLKYEDLYDAKTRLKELFDRVGQDLGYIKYKNDKQEHLHTAEVFLIDRSSNATWKKMGSGIGKRKVDAEIQAAEQMLQRLETMGIRK